MNRSYEKRYLQYDHQKGLCCWCGQKMAIGGMNNKKDSATWEHIIPLSKGGSDGIINRVLAHRECNNKRANTYRLPKFISYAHWHKIQDEPRLQHERELVKIFGVQAVRDLYILHGNEYEEQNDIGACKE